MEGGRKGRRKRGREGERENTASGTMAHPYSPSKHLGSRGHPRRAPKGTRGHPLPSELLLRMEMPVREERYKGGVVKGAPSLQATPLLPAPPPAPGVTRAGTDRRLLSALPSGRSRDDGSLFCLAQTLIPMPPEVPQCWGIFSMTQNIHTSK